MKRTRMSIYVMLLGMWLVPAVSAWGDSGQVDLVWYPEGTCTAAACTPDCDPVCNPCSSCCSKSLNGFGCCDLGDEWNLFGNYRGIELGGWVSAGLYGNEHGTTFNGPLGFNDVGDGFTFNQIWLYAEKKADTGGYGLDWGFRIDALFGVDGRDLQAFGAPGWDNGWDTGRDYGTAIPQFYAEVAYNDLSVKLGHFDTIIGYEVGKAPENFFYSHAYTMYYGEPFSHTGVLASYDLYENVTVHGGWTQGWDSGFDNTPQADTFLGGISVPLTANSTLTWAVSAGNLGIGVGDVYMNSFVIDWSLTDRLNYVVQHDFGTINGAAAAQWYGVNQYLLYEISDCWGAGIRAEWFRDDDGTRVINGSPGDYYEVTCGLNYRPHANLVIRPELRYDWFRGVGGGGLPFDNGTEREQLAAGFDVVLTY